VTRVALLSEAIGVGRGDVVALVGGGGKTTALLRLVEELAGVGWRVLASTTTKVGQSVAEAMPVALCPSCRPPDGVANVPPLPRTVGSACTARVSRDLAVHRSLFVASALGSDGKFVGVAPAALEALAAAVGPDATLVEADGSRQRSLKAPAEHEPVIPGGATIVCPMVGLDVLGRRIDDGTVHRPELLRAYAEGDRVTPDLVARVVAAPDGGMKRVPAGATVRPILNKVPSESRDAAFEIAMAILSETGELVDRVLVTDIRAERFEFVKRARG